MQKPNNSEPEQIHDQQWQKNKQHARVTVGFEQHHCAEQNHPGCKCRGAVIPPPLVDGGRTFTWTQIADISRRDNSQLTEYG